MREDVNAKTAKGRTCLGKCGQWKSKENFRVHTIYGTLQSRCKDCVRDEVRDRNKERRKDPEKYRAMRESNAQCRARLKREVVDAYGGKCACCGETAIEFMTLDHVNNDGAEERKASGHKASGTNYWYKARAEGYPDRFQLLCFNCNLSKGAYGYCPHQRF